ncbi:MAG: TspO/MBR family protein [Eubacteriales bacterium]|nr:TspO/MBR family protein [Eubacteriales bacterium]
MKKINWKALVASLGITLGAGVLSGLLTAGSMAQYENMYQPPLAPPGWLFPIVWTILYILMGIAAYLVNESGAPGREQAIKLYLGQLLVNVLWPVLFFVMEAYFPALAWLILLWYLIWKTIQAFAQIDKRAAYLMLPYLLWVTFAGYLNLAIALQAL